MRWKQVLHRYADPIIARLRDKDWRDQLNNLPDGEYHVPFDVPYVAQFASPERIFEYIHHQYDGTQDPNWHIFGASDPSDYAFWASRVCALACIKMAVESHGTAQPTLWELTQAGLAADGYRTHDEHGRVVDEGWFFAAQVNVAKQYGLQLTGYSYASPLGICAHIRLGHLVAATVTPDIGERDFSTRRYGGHLVLVLGFRWQQNRPTHYQIHNPSGRFSELQAHAWIPAKRFRQAYAYRFAVFQK